MKRIACAVSLVLLAACTSMEPDCCALRFHGSYRKLVKLRDPALEQEYLDPFGSEANPVTVAFLLQHACEVEEAKNVDKHTPAMDLERHVVHVRGFIQVVKIEPDRDFHIEISDADRWDSAHFVVEVPPGDAYCDARKTIWDLVKRDAAATGLQPGSPHFFDEPPQVQLTGFLFYDGQHKKKGAPCTSPGKIRGIHDASHPKRAETLWELHPVIAAR
jgi:hypothetical protein